MSTFGGADYRRHNADTRLDRDPIKRIEDVLVELVVKRILRKIDRLRVFHQIPIAESNLPERPVISPFGLYEFLVMPFGLLDVVQSFQRFMDETLKGLVFVFGKP